MKKQRGLSLITAIFLVVLLAGLSAAIVTVSVNSQSQSSLDVMGARAYQAARSGVEWGLYQAIINPPPMRGVCQHYLSRHGNDARAECPVTIHGHRDLRDDE